TQLLHRTRTTNLDAYTHQDLPFDYLVEALNPNRSLARHPLFQIALAFQNVASVNYSDLDITEEEIPGSISRFDLAFFLTDRHDDTGAPNGIEGKVEYATDLFDHATVEQLIHRLQTLLTAAVAHPDAPISDLDILLPGERRQILADHNNTTTPQPHTTIVERFHRQTATTPDAIAVTDGITTLTYRQLNERANQLAHHLITHHHAGPDTYIAVALPRTTDLLTTLLAILKTGAAYLPIDPDYPPTRINLLLNDAQPQLLITTKTTKLPPTSTPTLHHDDPGITAQPTTNPNTTPHPHHTAYLIYTSGSTGRPKGVMVSHAAIANRLAWMQAQFGLTPEDRVLQKTPAGFDVSVWEFFWPVIEGATLVMAKPEGHREPDYLAALIQRERITTIHFVPSMLTAFLQEPAAKACRTLKRVICSGEALPAQLAERFRASLDADLFNLYGPTEAAVDVTAFHCTADLPGASVPIGRPVWNTQMYVLDQHLRPLPPNVPGELYIAGVQLARGYHDRPALTAERFVANPYGTPGTRLYRTGDLARRLPDGTLDFLGRVDHQVKLRGVRIELGEVESTMLTHDALAEAAVTVDVDRRGEQRLIGYLVPDRTSAAPVRTLLTLERSGRAEGVPHLTFPDGTCVFYRNRSETEFLREEIWEGEEYLRNGIAIPEDACVFDVGAHIGMFTLYVAARAPKGVVHSFEPIPDLFQVLALNAELHGVNARLHPMGLSDTAGTVEFAYYPELSILSGLYADEDEDRAVVKAYTEQAWEEAAAPGAEDVRTLMDELVTDRMRQEIVSCEVRTLSQLIRETGVDRIDLLKIDAEKSERDILRGIEDAHWPIIDQIVAEVHDVGDRLHEITELLRAKGFQVATGSTSALDRTHLVTLYAVREARETAAPVPVPRWSDPARLVDDVREHLRDRLPPSMVPDALVVLDALPLTPNGKLDRRALPAPGRTDRRAHRAPRTRREEVLCRLFGEILGIPEVGIDDDFFELGGQSLLAIRLMSRVRAELGGELSIKAVFEAPTVASLADRIGGRNSREDVAVLLPIRAEGSEPPLFCVHELYGLSWVYRRLAGYVPAEVPVYGLQARGILEPDKSPRSVEEMALDYVARIRSVAPRGPYRLLGWSSGGNVAHAVATALQRQGDEVALLALLDSYVPEWHRGQSHDDEDAVLHRIVEFLGRADGREWDREGVLALLREEYGGWEQLGEWIFPAFVDAAVTTRAIVRESEPEVFKGDMLFFSAEHPGSERHGPHHGWAPYVTGQVERHPVPGEHNDMMEQPAIAEIGAVLARRLTPPTGGTAPGSAS
ncbi:amino acid adenylation domain-containing protein, partial [Nonomuraea sp. B12E4]|uniref:amino acid adenylation domain-containing protein n=1 Tax=Nonomuraea sp. B12E4 TaxID=3153564 RepID=UPI00325D7FBF